MPLNKRKRVKNSTYIKPNTQNYLILEMVQTEVDQYHIESH